MARVCDICGKRPLTGSIVSHAHNVSKTRRMPNLQTVNADVPGRNKRLKVCTRCLRSGKVKKRVPARAGIQAGSAVEKAS